MNNKDMAEFAENLWKNYIEPKMEATRTGDISYYRASVVANNGDGTLTIKPACDNERTANCTMEMSDITAGNEVLVMRMGNGNAAENHLVFAKINAVNPVLNMGGGIAPTGTISIVQNGTYDVTNYASADVSVPIGIFPSGTISITSNGTYNVSEYESANVNVNVGGYTADEIAMRTISGAVYGSQASEIGHWAFGECGAITEAYFPACISINSSAFRYCHSLKIASFPACKYIDMSAFYFNRALTSAYFPACTFIAQSAFYNCDALTTAHFPNCRTVGYNTFAACIALTTAIFPMCTLVSSTAFGGCYYLETVSFPVCSDIYSYAFMNCRTLSAVYFPACTSMRSAAFSECWRMATASFPVCINIGTNAFRYCFNLVSLYLTSVSRVTALGNNAFSLTPIGGYSASAGRYGSVFVPASLYDQFIVATNWVSISSRIVAV